MPDKNNYVCQKDESVFSDTPVNERMEKILSKTYGFAKLMTYYKCAIMEIETKFKVLNEEFSLRYDRQPISYIKTRLKQPLGICSKMEKRNIPITIDNMEENINDIAGIRVVCSFIDDVYMLADSLLKQDDVFLIKEKDYIKNPKENGYRSLHLIVSTPIFLAQEKRMMKAEIQLRTIAMDFWATLEHQMRYKKNNEFTEDMINELNDCAYVSANLDMRMAALREKCASERKKGGILP